MPTRTPGQRAFGGEEQTATADLAPPDTGSQPIEVPLLPLTGDVVFPRSIHPLTLEGEGAARLVREARARGDLVALFLQRELAGDPPTASDLHTVGTLARLEKVESPAPGTLQLTVAGLARVKLGEVGQWESVALARVVPLPEPRQDSPDIAKLFAQVRDLYAGLLVTSPAAGTIQDALNQTETAEELAYLVAATIPISPEARQAILEIDCAGEKLRQLVPFLTRAHEINASQTAASGAEPSRPTKLLPQASTSDALQVDLLELQEQLRECALPPEVRRVAERELDRLAGLTPASPDYSTVRAYLQCLADLPWEPGQELYLDLERAREILERDHYGLTDVKDRILEYLAVRELRRSRCPTGPDLDVRLPGEPVLCLVGPPGIGKTSLGHSVAEALGRPFARVSLGGITDEAEIRGHRRTYVGAMPGKIIQVLSRVPGTRPVIMLDEIDKIGSGGKGDPASALLEVLDPEQQRTFLDHYLDVPYNLSQVLFIATANMLDNVPPALRDRLEVIQLSGYTEGEKVQIALRYVIPRQMEWHALTARDVAWPEEGVLAIVRHYTREAGVRQLEREVAALCRRVAMGLARDEKRRYTIDGDFVAEVLGTPRYAPERLEVAPQPGVVTGVVWTPAGGDIIHVEASIMPGRETLTITGQIGEVMRESAQAALSFVRAEAASLGIEPDFFARHDIHLHVPSGAVPKDGPSAGVTMATALVSLLTNRTVPPTTAMTGEMTLRGRVLPVGGIKEKILAARRAGVELLILPTLNRRDVDSIAADLLEGIDFAFVESMDEVLQAAFAPLRGNRSTGPKPARKSSRPGTEDGNADGLPRAAKRR